MKCGNDDELPCPIDQLQQAAKLGAAHRCATSGDLLGRHLAATYIDETLDATQVNLCKTIVVENKPVVILRRYNKIPMPVDCAVFSFGLDGRQTEIDLVPGSIPSGKAVDFIKSRRNQEVALNIGISPLAVETHRDIRVVSVSPNLIELGRHDKSLIPVDQAPLAFESRRGEPIAAEAAYAVIDGFDHDAARSVHVTPLAVILDRVKIRRGRRAAGKGDASQGKERDGKSHRQILHYYGPRRLNLPNFSAGSSLHQSAMPCNLPIQ